MKLKKAFVSILLTLCLTVGICSISSAASTKAGDVDFDGMVTVEDALLVLRACAQPDLLTQAQVKAGDVTYDGKINSVDALRILLFVSGKIPSLGKLNGDEGDDIII